MKSNGRRENPVAAIEEGSVKDGVMPVHLITRCGEVHCRYYPAGDTDSAALWIGGAGGGWDTPARDLYPRTAERLAQIGIASLRIRLREAQSLDDSVFDARAGIVYLETRGASRLAVIGHSLGGAVAVRAAAVSPSVRTVVGLATQSYGAEPASRLGPRCSLLLIHGTADTVLPVTCSDYVQRIAREPKRLILYEGAGHSLKEAAGDVHVTVYEWILEQLGRAREKAA